MGEQPRGKAEPPRQRKPANLLAPPPWLPPVATLEIAGAIQALVRGEAQPHQQRMALEFIIHQVSEYYDMSYRPGGEEGRRETDFAEGKRFVGAQIVKLTKIDLRTFDQPRGEN